MLDSPVSRRRFLKGSGTTLAGVLAFASGPIALMTPSRSWALEVRTLSGHEARTMLHFTRHLFPHEGLEDAVYALVVKDLDEAAGTDPAVRKRLGDGVARLDADTEGGRWLDLAKARQFEHVRAMAGGPFFETVRSTAVVSLYDNDMAFAHFGYEGPAGNAGYLRRGFNDLDWLPAPPAAASGPIPGASS